MRKYLNMVFRKISKVYSKVDEVAKFYRKTQNYTAEEIKNLQELRLQELLIHSYKNVKYYRDILDKKIIKKAKLSDLKNIPILTKDKIRENFNDLKSSDLELRGWRMNSSGGSTGEPIKIIQDQKYIIHSEARKQIAFEWAGYKPGQKIIRLWGSERDIIGKGIFYEKVKDFFHNQKTLNAFILKPKLVKKFIDVINRSSAKIILAYVNAIYELSDYGLKNKLKLKNPKKVISTSGNLYPFVRNKIEDFVGCKVFDQYGSREVSCIASECECHDGLHICEETIVLEIVDSNGRQCPEGVEGDVLVTSLVNFSMPLIRYKIGDRASYTSVPCRCNKPYKRLVSVSGRIMDNFKLRNGTVIPSEYFIHFIGVVLNKGAIKKIQLIQKNYDLIHLNIIYDKLVKSEGVEQSIIKCITDVMGKECKVHVIEKKEIKPSSSGKYRYTICEI